MVIVNNHIMRTCFNIVARTRCRDSSIRDAVIQVRINVYIFFFHSFLLLISIVRVYTDIFNGLTAEAVNFLLFYPSPLPSPPHRSFLPTSINRNYK